MDIWYQFEKSDHTRTTPVKLMDLGFSDMGKAVVLVLTTWLSTPGHTDGSYYNDEIVVAHSDGTKSIYMREPED